MKNDELIISEFVSFINGRDYPCFAAKAAVAQNELRIKVVADMSSSGSDEEILKFLYHFTKDYRRNETSTNLYKGAAVVFSGTEIPDEQTFDELMWTRLQSLSDLDSRYFKYDSRVDSDPSSPRFSFSLMEEAFFIVGMHPKSSRPARRFIYPALVFNPHGQFERLRDQLKYEPMKRAIRKRDRKFAGSVNPMLKDHGLFSEVYQYSGINYGGDWRCPLHTNHGRD